MSVQTEIDRIKGNITAALTAVADKGVTVPDGSTSDDLAALVAAIEAGGGKALWGTYTVTTNPGVQNFKVTHNFGVVPNLVLFAANCSTTDGYRVSGVAYNNSHTSLLTQYSSSGTTCYQYSGTLDMTGTGGNYQYSVAAQQAKTSTIVIGGSSPEVFPKGAVVHYVVAAI